LTFEISPPTDPTVVTLRHTITAPDWEQWYLLRSDAHHDNTHCRQELEQKHLEQAKARGAGVLDFGDLFCAMQGKWDKRADATQLREELRVANYLDALVNYNGAFYAPYAENFVLLSKGNHEGSIMERHQTDLTQRLAERLQAAGSGVQVGRYQGWARFMFTFHRTKQQTVRLRYTHGYGGGGPVTRDLIQAQRQLAILGNVDILVSGHTHDAWHVAAVQEFLDLNGRPHLATVDCVKCGGYKDEYSGGTGWAVTKGLPPKPLGAYWCRFYLGERGGETAVRHEITRAD